MKISLMPLKMNIKQINYATQMMINYAMINYATHTITPKIIVNNLPVLQLIKILKYPLTKVNGRYLWAYR
jgi:hypothetical protein